MIQTKRGQIETLWLVGRETEESMKIILKKTGFQVLHAHVSCIYDEWSVEETLQSYDKEEWRPSWDLSFQPNGRPKIWGGYSAALSYNHLDAPGWKRCGAPCPIFPYTLEDCSEVVGRVMGYTHKIHAPLNCNTINYIYSGSVWRITARTTPDENISAWPLELLRK